MGNFNDVLEVKAGALEPIFFVYLLQADGVTPLNISGVQSAQFRMRTELATTLAVNNQPMQIVNASLGQLQYQWQPGDTSTPGRYLAEVQCNFLMNGPLIMPTHGYYRIYISPRLP